MTAAAAGPQPAITAKPGANPAPTTNSSPAHRNKELPNPQQGMADGTNAAGGGVTSNNTACTSPLTVTSLEAAAAATATAGVPQVVSQVVPTHSQPPQSKPASTVESMLGKLSLNHPVQQQQPPVPHRPMEDKKMRLRTPPTERDCRKLFVGGLPTDVTDREFLEFFQQYGEVIDSVVIIDRITKRSRGFGFVTFATETCAHSLLTAIPGKTGYVHINGKQCEVKASTPKADDGSYKPRHNHHHHGAPGMWRSNPPRHDGNRGYITRHPMSNAARVAAAAQMKQQAMMQHQHQQAMMQHQHQPRGGKNFTIDNDFNGDVDGRNFDQLHQPSLQVTPGYPNMYSRGLPATNLPLYQYNNSYQNPYSSGSLGSYGYPSVSSSASATSMSSYDSSYPSPATGQGYVPYSPGSYDPYAAVPYPGGYGVVGGDGPSPAIAGQLTGYSNYGGHNAEGGAPSQGRDDDNRPQPYSRAYPEGGNDHADAAEQYE